MTTKAPTRNSQPRTNIHYDIPFVRCGSLDPVIFPPFTNAIPSLVGGRMEGRRSAGGRMYCTFDPGLGQYLSGVRLSSVGWVRNVIPSYTALAITCRACSTCVYLIYNWSAVAALSLTQTHTHSLSLSVSPLHAHSPTPFTCLLL